MSNILKCPQCHLQIPLSETNPIPVSFCPACGQSVQKAEAQMTDPASGQSSNPRTETSSDILPPLPPSLRPSLAAPPPIPSFGGATATSMAHSGGLLPVPPAPWNPATIAWLGLLFTPLWATVMAMVNYRRLGVRNRWWRPLLTGMLVVFVVNALLYRTGLPDGLILISATAAGIGGLYIGDLSRQRTLYEQGVGGRGRKAAWVAPSLLGSPLALLVFIGLFTPLEPQVVCVLFMEAPTEAAEKKYCTSTLWPALHAMAELDDDEDGTTLDYELTGEWWAPPDVGGKIVGFRWVIYGGPDAGALDGFFHLIDRDGWKIDDLYFTGNDDMEFEKPVSLAESHQYMFQDDAIAGRPPP